MFKSIIDSFHQLASKSSIFVNLSLLLRNQCNSIISYHISTTSNPNKNGEKEIIDFLAPVCSIVFDVGANKGEWTDYFKSKNSDAKLFLFEPSDNAFKFLKNKYNNLQNIIIVNKGVGEANSEVYFFEEPHCGETSSLISGFSNKNSVIKKVQLLRIDDFADSLGINKIDYLKIDVEGYDFMALKGSFAFLENQKINFIQFEYNHPWAKAGSTLYDAISFLKKFNYSTFLLRNKGLYYFNYDRYGEFYRYSNFFSLPQKNINQVASLIKGEI